MSLADPRSLAATSSARTLNGDELLRIAEIHDVQNHFQEALTYYEQALSAFRENKQRRREAVTLLKIGSIFERQGRQDLAAVRLREAVALFTKFPGQPAQADALLALGRISAWQGDREQAGRLFQQAVRLFGKSSNARGAVQAMVQLGLFQVTDGQVGDGMKTLEQALIQARTGRDDIQSAAVLLAIGDAWWLRDQPPDAQPYYLQALALVEKGVQPHLEAELLRRLSGLNATMGYEEQGVVAARRAITLYQSLRESSGEAASWALLAVLYRELGWEKDAGDAAEQALIIYQHQQLFVHAIRSAGQAAQSVTNK